MAYDATFLQVSEIQWLGVFVQDSDNYSIPQQCLLPLTVEGKTHTFIVSYYYSFSKNRKKKTDK